MNTHMDPNDETGQRRGRQLLKADYKGAAAAKKRSLKCTERNRITDTYRNDTNNSSCKVSADDRRRLLGRHT